MTYFISKQRVSIRDGNPIKNARRRLIKSVDCDSESDARQIFELECSNQFDKLYRYELTTGQWKHIAYCQEGIVK